MPVTPTSFLALPLDTLQTMLANCASFQAWTASANATEAKDSVYVIGVDAPPDGGEWTAEYADSLRPFVLIGYHPQNGADLERVGSGQGEVFAGSWRLAVVFEDTIKIEDDTNYKDAAFEFLNQVGAVIDDLTQQAGRDDKLEIGRIRLEAGPRRSSDTERSSRGDYFYAAFSIDVSI